jgi:hypothetical protein
LLLMLFVSTLLAASSSNCRIEKTDYSGWSAVQMSNAWVKLTLVPQLGGRLMQVSFGAHGYLFVNKQLVGRRFLPSSRLPRSAGITTVATRSGRCRKETRISSTGRAPRANLWIAAHSICRF